MVVYNEITSRIVSIVLTLCFFVVGTFLWQKLHINYLKTQEVLNGLEEVSVNSELILNDLKRVSDKKINTIDSYSFTINNLEQEEKNFYIKLIDYTNGSKIDNNYLHYMIKKDNGRYSEIRSLNMDGAIYFDSLKTNETSTYELKIWVSENYRGDVNYRGNLVTVNI